QTVNSLGDRPRLRQHCASSFGQARPAGRLAVEQFDTELRLQIGNPVADHRRRAMELAAGRGETAGFNNRQKNLQLIESRDTRTRHSYFLEPNVRFYPTIGKDQ